MTPAMRAFLGARRPKLPRDSKVVPLLWRAQFIVEERVRHALRTSDAEELSVADCQLLWHVREGPRFLDQLRESLQFTRQTIWSRVRSLERRGYLIVEPHSDQGRLQARLTDHATPVIELIDDAFADLMGDLVDSLGQQQFDSFKLGLAVLAAEPVTAEIPSCGTPTDQCPSVSAEP